MWQRLYGLFLPNVYQFCAVSKRNLFDIGFLAYKDRCGRTEGKYQENPRGRGDERNRVGGRPGQEFCSSIGLEEAYKGQRESKPPADHPDEVVAAPRLKHDASALSDLLAREVPPWRFIRGDKVATAQYGFGDASKSGFGAMFEDQNGNIWFCLGTW